MFSLTIITDVLKFPFIKSNTSKKCFLHYFNLILLKSFPTQIAEAVLSSDSGNQAAETKPAITKKHKFPIASKACPVNCKARKRIKIII